MKVTPFQTGVVLYGLTAGLAALIETPDPITWRALAGVALAVVIAVKAKISPDKSTEENNESV